MGFTGVNWLGSRCFAGLVLGLAIPQTSASRFVHLCAFAPWQQCENAKPPPQKFFFHLHFQPLRSSSPPFPFISSSPFGLWCIIATTHHNRILGAWSPRFSRQTGCSWCVIRAFCYSSCCVVGVCRPVCLPLGCIGMPDTHRRRVPPSPPDPHPPPPSFSNRGPGQRFSVRFSEAKFFLALGCKISSAFSKEFFFRLFKPETIGGGGFLNPPPSLLSCNASLPGLRLS